MPIPENVVRVNVNWNMHLGEIAVNSFHFAHEHVAGNQLDWAGNMTARYAHLVLDGLVAAWPAASSLWPRQVSLRDVTAYHLGTDGKTIDKQTALPPSGGLSGASSQGSLPMEVATVVSLYGYAAGVYDPLGARKRGRVYLPPQSTSSCTTEGFNADVASVRDFMTAWLGYCNGRVMDAIPDVEGAQRERARLVVLSRKYGIVTPVAQVRVDNLFDVQRRRQNAYPVFATSAPLPRQDH